MRDFNFFEPFLSNKKKKNSKKIAYRVGVFILLGIFIIIPLMNLYTIRKLENEVVETNNTMNTSENYEERKDIEIKVQKIDELKKKLKKLKKIETDIKEKDIINDFLIYTIRDMVPENLFFESITIHPDNVEICGIAKNKIAIAELKHNFKNIDIFKNIFIPTISGNEGRYEFMLSFTIKDVSRDETN
ncbi:PilN domain-containing protein [Crassaminicella thermophila]|uniref:PilN domain-containing protein n=1 Tax=Crassaminicella thermophila TaxID=2599308 RepID=A0A5C0SDU5_CRATE|nr:PilN domain-containing protein [Crassaminicella thermophila]QEK12132.1 PilN domain-containing protein [Crassaminicella thermophila]